MSDLGKVLELWRSAHAAGEEYVLATVVEVEGSSYRKPGARMLLTRSGRRAGSISGGCLESEVSRKAWWLTESGASLQQYSTFFDIDGEVPYGLGCGGTVNVLLERQATAHPLLEWLHARHQQRLPGSVATVAMGATPGQRCLHVDGAEHEDPLARVAAEAMHREASFMAEPAASPGRERVFAEYVPPRLGLFVFGAGDDAQPLVEMAGLQGWHTAVIDGRANLPTRERFPSADSLFAMQKTEQLPELSLRQTDAAVLMTHSYEQDRRWLQKLLPRGLRYLGLLGPRKRTQTLLEEVAPTLGWSVEACWERVKSPVGLDLGAETPAAIGLAIAAEIEAASHTTPQRRREVLLAPAGGASLVNRG